jgi:hypothetical protein
MKAVGDIIRVSGVSMTSPIMLYILSWCATSDMIAHRRILSAHDNPPVLEESGPWHSSCAGHGHIIGNIHHQPLNLCRLLNSMIDLHCFRLGHVHTSISILKSTLIIRRIMTAWRFRREMLR